MKLLAGGLASDQDYEVRFLVADFGQPDIEQYGKIVVQKVYSLGRKSILQKISGAIILFGVLVKIRPDLCITRGAGIETGIIGIYKMFFRKRYVLMISHNSECKRRFSDVPGGVGFRYFSYYFALRTADKIIAQTQHQQSELQRNYRLSAKVLHNSWNLPDKKRKTPVDNRTGVLWVARLEPWKGPETIMELARECPSIRFRVVGRISESQEYGEGIVRLLEVCQNVTYLGGLSLGEVDNEFSRARVFLNTSIDEGYPNTFVQALMHGTPVVSLNVNPDGMLDKWKVGYCADGSKTDCRDAIRLLNGDDKHWLVFSDASQEYASNHHDLNRNLLCFKSIVKSTLMGW